MYVVNAYCRCNIFTCYRYRVAARMHASADSSATNIGFRCVAGGAMPENYSNSKVTAGSTARTVAPKNRIADSSEDDEWE